MYHPRERSVGFRKGFFLSTHYVQRRFRSFTNFVPDEDGDVAGHDGLLGGFGMADEDQDIR